MLGRNLFLYWGGRKLSYLRLLTIVSFKRFNPDFKIFLLIPKFPNLNVDWGIEQSKEYCGIDYIEEAKRLSDEVIEFSMDCLGFPDSLPEVQKSDIVRTSLLINNSGIWSDFDIIYFKKVPLDLIGKDFVCRHPIHQYYSIGFMGSSRESKLYRTVLRKQIEAKRNSADYQKYGSKIYKLVNSSMAINIPMSLVYYFDSDNIAKIFEIYADLPMESIGIHWYGGSPITRHWENIVNPYNYDTFGNTISEKLKCLRM